MYISHAKLDHTDKPSNTYFVSMMDIKCTYILTCSHLIVTDPFYLLLIDYLSNCVAQVVICLQQNIKIE